jgi:hypothetical protein
MGVAIRGFFSFTARPVEFPRLFCAAVMKEFPLPSMVITIALYHNWL